MSARQYCSEQVFAFSPTRPLVDADLAARLRPVSLAVSRRLPLEGAVAALAPDGLRRGASVAVVAPPGWGAVSLAFALVAPASAAGHWVGAVGVESPGVGALADLGVDLARVLFVPRPRGAWAEAAADLLDGVDLLVVRPPGRASVSAARRLADRARERATVLVALAEPGAPWPLPTDLTLTIAEARWDASSRLDARRVCVRVGGRGALSRGAVVDLVLPDARGRAAAG